MAAIIVYRDITDFTYISFESDLIDGLAVAPNKINGTLNVTRIEVVTPLEVCQCVLHAYEPALVERDFV